MSSMSKREGESAIEEWRPVVGYEGLYEVSSLGRVRSITRRIDTRWGKDTRTLQGKVLSPIASKYGYLQLTLTRDRRGTSHRVHRLVCEAFHGPAPEGKPLALHGANGVSDNSRDNLRWGSNSDNMKDRVRDRTCINSLKTHCPRGHEYTLENTLRTREGTRRCRERHRIASAMRRRNSE